MGFYNVGRICDRFVFHISCFVFHIMLHNNAPRDAQRAVFKTLIIET